MRRSFTKNLFLSGLAIFFPWVILLLDDNPSGALIAMILQATGVGWIPASAWAWGIVHGEKKKRTPDESPKE